MSGTRGLNVLLVLNVLLLAALAWSTARAGSEDAPQDVVRARLFELVNEKGEMRAQLHIGENGGGQLRFRSRGGDIRVKLGATDDGAILVLLDGSANPAVRLASEADGASLRVGAPGRETVIGPPAISPLSAGDK
jgi:hypothetical protein